MFQERGDFKLFNEFLLFRRPFLFEETSPFTQGFFLQSLVEIGPVVLEKKMKVKVYSLIDRICDHHDRSRKETNCFQSYVILPTNDIYYIYLQGNISFRHVNRLKMFYLYRISTYGISLQILQGFSGIRWCSIEAIPLFFLKINADLS